LSVCAFVGIGVFALWPGEREPEYNGKKLSEWLRRAGFEETRAQVEAADAIQHIGTNALPWLVRWVGYEPPLWHQKGAAVIDKIPRLNRWWHRADYAHQQRVMDSEKGFRILGTNAAPALPELARIVKNSRWSFGRRNAPFCAACIGKDGLPVLFATLTNDTATARMAAVNLYYLARQGYDISPAGPTLLLNWGTFSPITFQSGDLEWWVRVLAGCLHDTNSEVRLKAANNLARFRDRARPAVPALKAALDDRVVAVQESARLALQKIAPEVLTNGVKSD
jgi:hypothetical protein